MDPTDPVPPAAVPSNEMVAFAVAMVPLLRTIRPQLEAKAATGDPRLVELARKAAFYEGVWAHVAAGGALCGLCGGVAGDPDARCPECGGTGKG